MELLHWHPGILAGLGLGFLAMALWLGRLSWQLSGELGEGGSLGKWALFLGSQWVGGACLATFILLALRLLARLVGG